MKVFQKHSLPSVKVHALAPDDLHLSLSRTFVLAHHLIPSYVSSLDLALQRLSPSIGAGRTFLLAFSSAVKIYFNDEKTRGFIAIQVHPSSTKQLRHLISAVDSTLKEFNLRDQLFYSDPSFHLSLAWFIPRENGQAGGAKEGGAKEHVYDASEEDVANGISSSSSSIELSTSSSSSSLSTISPDVVSSLEKSLSSVVADHFRETDDRTDGFAHSSSSSNPSSSSSSTSATVNEESIPCSDVTVASTAIVVKRVMLKTGNKLHSFPL